MRNIGICMAQLITHQTEIAHWHDLIFQGQRDASIALDHDVEGYVVMMLMRYVKDTQFSNVVLGLDYLKSFELSGQCKTDHMQKVADQCLLYAGLFPGRAERKRVSKHYFTDLGRSAYSILVERVAMVMPTLSELYEKLCIEFTSISHVLCNMRAYREQG